MYFANPQQLLDIFTALEEQNLFLIQNSQETEQALEELKANSASTKKDMDVKTRTLNENIGELKAQIGAEESKGRALKLRIAASTGGTQGRQEALLDELHVKVKDVYEKCGFESGSNPSTIFMLSELEARLEDLLSSLAQMPGDYVIKAEKEKEKKRRERKRQEQQAYQDKLQEERNRKAIERSKAPPKTRTGRQVMFRSAPVRRAIQNDAKEDTQEDLDELKHLT